MWKPRLGFLIHTPFSFPNAFFCFCYLSSFSQQRELMHTFQPGPTVCTLASSAVNIPNPVRGGRWDVDSQRSAAFLHLHGEQQRRVGHLLHLLLDELRLRGFLEVLGLGYFVHEAHYLARSVATHKAALWEMKVLSFIQNIFCPAHYRSAPDWCVMTKEKSTAAAHPSPPAGTALSLRSSGGSSSSDEPALDDSSSLSARQYVRGLRLSHKHRHARNPLVDA